MSASFSSTPRTALVTGAGKRLGREIALGLARAGWRVAVHYRSSEAEALQTAADCLQAFAQWQAQAGLKAEGGDASVVQNGAQLQLQNFKEGTPEYDKAAIYNKAIDRGIFNLVFLNESFDNNLERVNGIVNRLNRSPLFASQPSLNFQTLTDTTRLTNTIDMLSTEIESLKGLQTAGTEAQIKDKQELLDALSEFEAKQQEINKLQALDFFEEAKQRYKEEGNEDEESVTQAFDELIENGFNIERVEVDKFMIYDNGKFGFVSEEDPFIVDGDGVLEIYEMYLVDKKV